MKVVLVRFKKGERRELVLEKDTTVVGRRPDSDLRVASQDVSRRHCEIAVAKGKVSVKDLGSSNGTYVNGKRVAESDLSAGDRLTIGPLTFVVQIDGKPSAIKPADLKVDKPADAPTGAAADLDEEEVFELGEDDFDIDDAITALDDLDDDDDMP